MHGGGRSGSESGDHTWGPGGEGARVEEQRGEGRVPVPAGWEGGRGGCAVIQRQRGRLQPRPG